MTNGEKIQEIFKGCDICEPIVEDNIIHVVFADDPGVANAFSWDWWNKEYKEPEEDLTDEQLLYCMDCIHIEMCRWYPTLGCEWVETR